MKRYFWKYYAPVETPAAAPKVKNQEELFGEINRIVEQALSTRATKEELEAIKDAMPDSMKDMPLEALRAMADEKNGVMVMLSNQGLEISRLKTAIKQQQTEDLSIRAQCKKYIEENKAIIDNLKTRKGDLPEFKVNLSTRAANSPMLPSNTYGGSAFLPKIEYLPGIVDIIRPDYTFWNYIKKGASSSANLVWINKKNPQGAAAFIAPGVYKPNISFTIATETSNAKKIAANEKMAVELLKDIDGFATWVEEELVYQVYQKASLTLMSGIADSETPAGIQSLSVTFAGAALGVVTTNANNWDAIRACVAQLRRANFTKGVITAFVNPVDMANMVMTKANNQGQLFIPPVTGAVIVEDNNIPVGYVQVAMLDYYQILVYEGFTMSYGWENQDFTKNLVTVIGEMRIHQIFSENHVGAFIYDTFDNIIAGITEVAP